MKFYLASRYGRKKELQKYANQLISNGHNVTSTWLKNTDENDAVTMTCQRMWAQVDIDDIIAADALIAFTEEEGSEWSRGGRHVELGIALGLGKRVYVIGPAENIFCWLCVRISNWDFFMERCINGNL